MSNAPYEIDEEEISNEAIAVYKEGFSPEKVDSYLEMKGAVYGWQDNRKQVFKSAYDTIDKRIKKAESIQPEALAVFSEGVDPKKYVQMKREVYGWDDEEEELFDSLHENFKTSPEMRKTVELAFLVDDLKNKGTTVIDPDEFDDPETRRSLRSLFTEQNPLIKIPDNWKLKVDEWSLGKPVKYISPRQMWDKQGGQGALERVSNTGIASKIPSFGLGLSIGEGIMIRRSIKRLEEAQKAGKDIYKDKDLERELDWLQNISIAAEHEMARGTTWGGDVAEVLMEAPAFIAEFLMSGPAAAGAKGATKKLVKDTVLKGVKNNLLKRTAVGLSGRLASGLARTAVVGQPRAANTFLGLDNPVAVFDGPNDLRIIHPKDGTIKNALKAEYFTLVEYFSEEMGDVIGKGVGKVANKLGGQAVKRVGGRALKLGSKELEKIALKSPSFNSVYSKLQSEWMKKTGKTAAAWAKKLDEIGYQGVIEEFGEERLGEILRGENPIPSAKQIKAELVSFGLMGAGFAGAGAVQNRSFKKGVREWAQQNPAAARELAKLDSPSRSNWPSDLPKMNKEDRAAFAEILRNEIGDSLRNQIPKEVRETVKQMDTQDTQGSEIPAAVHETVKEPVEPEKPIVAQQETPTPAQESEEVEQPVEEQPVEEEEVEPPVIPEGSKATAEELSVESAWQPDKDIVRVPTKDILSDPDTFQYKLNIDKKTGVKEPLKGPWDDEISGIMTLWQSKDGKTYVVNGHHRLELAQREGVENVRAVVLREADGITAQAARFRGAVQNIKSGRGSIEDAATMWRLIDDKDIKSAEQSYRGNPKDTIPYRIGRFATNATYELWRNGKIQDGQAAAISGAAPRNETDQKTAVDYVFDAPKASENEIRVYLESLKHFASPDYVQPDIFGEDPEYQNNKEIEKRMSIAAEKKRAELNAAITMINRGDKIDKSELAKQLGMSVQSLQDMNKLKRDLKVELGRYNKFYLHKDLTEELRKMAKLELANKPVEEKPTEPAKEVVAEKKVEPVKEPSPADELKKLFVPQLRALPEAKGLKKMRKDALIEAILAKRAEKPAEKAVEPVVEKPSQKAENEDALVEEIVGTGPGKGKEWFENIVKSIHSKNSTKYTPDEVRQDASMEVLNAVRKFRKEKPDANLDNYASVVVRNGLTSLYEKRMGKESKETALDEKYDVADKAETPEGIAQKSEVSKSIEASISKLEATEQKIVRMFSDGKTEREIADELDMSPSTVHSKKLKAFESMRKNIDGYTDETGSVPSTTAMSNRYKGEVEEDKADNLVGLSFGQAILMLKDAGADIPTVLKKLRLKGAAGVFKHKEGEEGWIELKADIFIGPVISTGLANPNKAEWLEEALVMAALTEYPNLKLEDLKVVNEKEKNKRRITVYRIDADYAKKVLAHEIGHWVDYMPDLTMSKGNLIGRLFVLHNYLKSTIDSLDVENAMPAKAISKLRDQARKTAGEKPAKGTPAYDAWKKDYEKAYNKLVRESGFVSKSEIENELKELTQWWNPFEPTEDGEYTRYRFSSKELYAEAVSVLLNRPAELKKRAPGFYALFFQTLEQKPDFMEAYEQIRQDVVSGVSSDKQLEGIYSGFRQGKIKELEIAEKSKKEFSVIQTIFTAFLDRFSNVYRAVKIAKKNGKKFVDPREMIDKAQYSGSQIEEYQYRNDEIANDLEKENISEDDFGVYLFIARHKNAKGEAGLRAIPSEIGTLEDLNNVDAKFREAMGERKMAALEEARKKYRAIRKKFVLDRIDKSKPYTQDYIDFLMDNEYYSKDEVIDYMDKSAGKGTGLKMFARTGTLKAIRNSWHATMAADMTLIYSLNWNHAKQSVNDFLKENGAAGQYQEAKKVEGMPVEPSDNKLGLVTFMRDGKLEGFYTEKYIAEAFNKVDGAAFHAVVSMLRFVSHPARMWFTVLRPGFQMYNLLLKDPLRTIVNTDISARELYWQLPKSVFAALKDSITHSDKTFSEMRERGVLVHQGSLAEQDNDTKQLEKFLGQNNDPTLWEKNVARPFSRWWETFKTVLNVGDAANKHAGFVLLNKNKEKLGLTDAQIDHRVRHWVGTPSSVTGGTFTPVTNNIAMFSNIAAQGWRSDYEAYKSDRSGYIARRILYSMFPKMVMVGFFTGAVTAVLKSLGAGDDDPAVLWAESVGRILRKQSEYDLINYTVIPLGEDASGKGVALRIPLDETGRVISGAFANLFMSDDYLGNIQNSIGYMGNQVPGTNPAFTLGYEVLKYISGGNPYDDFRERTAVPKNIREAGGTESHKIFSKWLWNKYGGSMVYKFSTDNPLEIRTELQEFLDLPFMGDTAGRFIRISDQGIDQKADRALKQSRSVETREKLDVKNAVKKEMRGDELTDEEKKLLEENYSSAERYRKTLQEQGGDVVVSAMGRALSADDKLATLKTLVKEKGKKDPAVMQELNTFVGMQAFQMTSPKPKERVKIPEWNKDQTDVKARIRQLGMTSMEVRAAFNSYWLKRGYKKGTATYAARIRMLNSLLKE